MRLAALLLATLAVVPGAAYATTFTDGFASIPLAGQNTDVTAAGNFTAINGTNVDVLSANDGFGGLCTGVAVCVDLGGSGGNPFGDLVSNVSFAPGTYDLNLVITGSGRGIDTTTTVNFGNLTQTFDLTSSQVVDYSGIVTITAGGPAEFILTGTSDGNVGSVLDSVNITSVAATPEPSSLVLLGSGLLSGAGALMRRRKK